MVWFRKAFFSLSVIIAECRERTDHCTCELEFGEHLWPQPGHNLVTIQHVELGEYELVTLPSSATCNVLEVIFK